MRKWGIILIILTQIEVPLCQHLTWLYIHDSVPSNVASPLKCVQIMINILILFYIGVHNSNGSVGPEGYKYFLSAVGLFPRLRELPVALNLRTLISLFPICWIDR